MDVFAAYQRESAWTWEQQALIRARPVAGNVLTGEHFNRLRQDALERPRNSDSLRADLVDMRTRMVQEFGGAKLMNAEPKHQPGGLVDIGFIVQFGVLDCASRHPGRFTSTSTPELMQGLVEVGWLAPADAGVLEKSHCELQRQRMLETLAPGEHGQRIDSTAAAAIFERLLGTIPRTPT
jgi:glutamate-ammonia-ligase adenylyltransferase